ncbi:MAG TPA: toprim domain-containing protein, partial [Thermomicrobiales bacterium]|nr:toprim domain-containing protein [Thermomicrobiales bacterium]
DLPPTPVYTKPAPPPDNAQLKPNGRRFFTERGIDPDLAVQMGVYSDAKDTALAFPYTRAGDTIHVKYRGITDKRFWSSKDTEPVFYNLDSCHGATDVLITEGEMDVLALMSVGIDTALSVPNGAPNPGQKADGKLACMASAHAIFDAAKRVIIAVDTDDPGKVLADELVRRIGPEKCFIVTWPAGAKDANDTLMQHGAQALMQAVADAKPVPINGLIYANDVQDDIWRNRHGRQRRGVEIPQWKTFNELYRVGEGHLTIVTGTPGSGKSAFLAAMLTHVAKNDPSWSFVVFSPEQTPAAEFFEALVMLRLGLPVEKVTYEDFQEAIGWVNQHFILQAPEDRTLTAILELARVCVLRHGVKGVVIDPWTEVEAMRLAGMGESEHIGLSLARIRAFGQMHRTHMWVAAHPTKPDRLNAEKPIEPYEISGSANWFNKADAMLSVYRHDRTSESSPVDVLIQKTRFKAFGHNGKASFGFDVKSGRYYEIDQHSGERA